MDKTALSLAVVGVGLLTARHFVKRGRNQHREESEDESVTPLILVPAIFDDDDAGSPDDAGAPGEPCDHGEGLATWDHDGNCTPYWFDGDTDDAVLALATAQWEDRGRPTVSEMCLAQTDPLGGEFAAPTDNPVMIEIVASVLHEYYGVMSTFPPKEDSHPWVRRAWERGQAVIRRGLCGVS